LFFDDDVDDDDDDSTFTVETHNTTQSLVYARGTRGNAVPPNILWGNTVPPNDMRTRGNGDIVAFPRAGLQRNAKSMVS